MNNNKKPVICILGAGFATGNLGVAALASGTVVSALNSFPHARVFLLDFSRNTALYHVPHANGMADVELVNLRYTKRVWLSSSIVRLLIQALFLRVLPLQVLRRKIIARNPVFTRISESAILGSLAGGDSFSDIYGLNRLIYVILPQLLVILLGKRLIQLPQTYGPYNTWLASFIARFVLRRSHLIFSRDRHGVKLVRGMLKQPVFDGRVKFAYDMGIALLPSPPPLSVMEQISRIKSKGELVGLNVNGLLYIGGYTRNNMFGLQCNYHRLIQELIEYFVRRHKAQVLLIPHVYGQGSNSEGDNQAINEIYAQCAAEYPDDLHFLQNPLNHSETKHVIGQCDFFVGSRMHACIAAISQCVPAIPLAYSGKFIGVMQSISEELQTADMRQLSNEDVLAMLDNVYSNRARLRCHLQGIIPTVVDSARRMFRAITPCWPT